MRIAKDSNRFRQWWLSLLSGLVFLLLGASIFVGHIVRYADFAYLLVGGFLIVGFLRAFYAVSNRQNLQYFSLVLVNGLLEIGVVFVPFLLQAKLVDILPTYVGFLILFRCIIGLGVAVNFYSGHSKLAVPVFLFSLIGIIAAFLMIWQPISSGLDILLYPALTLLAVGIAQFGIAFGLRELNRGRRTFE